MPQVPLSELVDAARSGNRLISFPTDTVPALAVRPDRSALIFQAKQRSQDKPLILMGGDPDDLWSYVKGTPEEFRIWQEVAAQYWAGALTLVLPASDRIPPEMNPTDSTTLGVRVPDHAIARHILSQTGPLATTSINRSGQPPLQTIEAINAEFPNVLTLTPQELATLYPSLMPDSPATTQSGTPSTVAKWTGEGWQILRQGSIRLEEA